MTEMSEITRYPNLSPYESGYADGYQAGLRHGGDDGLAIATPLAWNDAIEAAAELVEQVSIVPDFAARIRKLRKE